MIITLVINYGSCDELEIFILMNKFEKKFYFLFSNQPISQYYNLWSRDLSEFVLLETPNREVYRMLKKDVGSSWEKERLILRMYREYQHLRDGITI